MTEPKKPDETRKLNQTDKLDSPDSQPSNPSTKPTAEQPAKTAPKPPADETRKLSQTDNLETSDSNPNGQGVTPPDTRRDLGIGRDTAILSASSSRFRRMLQHQPPPGSTASLGDQREIIFVIRGMVERIVLTEKLQVLLGRSEPGSRSQVDIDLTPYGALDRGVSRVHARLHLEDNRIFITDLGSTNGTFVAGKKLEPNQPEPLRKGDELLLGRLPVQVLFR